MAGEVELGLKKTRLEFADIVIAKKFDFLPIWH